MSIVQPVQYVQYAPVPAGQVQMVPAGQMPLPGEQSTFEHKEYDITPITVPCCCLSYICFKVTLVLEPEFLFVNTWNLCGTNKVRMAYGEVSVDKTSCCCFVAVNGWSPGCGCESAKVNEISEELQKRVNKRGNTGQIQRAEQTLEAIHHLNAKVDMLERKLDMVIQNQMMQMQR